MFNILEELLGKRNVHISRKERGLIVPNYGRWGRRCYQNMSFKKIFLETMKKSMHYPKIIDRFCGKNNFVLINLMKLVKVET